MAERAAPRAGRPTTYRGLHDMADWWAWSAEAAAISAASYRPFVRPGSLVFDVGANRGQKTLIFRQLGARVVAVDPLFAFGDEFVPEFAWRFGKDPGVVQVPAAVSPQASVTISVNKFIPEYSSVDARWMSESAHAPKFGQTYYVPTSLITRQVQATTLDALIADYGLPAFVKIDVEGHEDLAVRTLSQAVPALNMEFHRDWIPTGAMEHLGSLGRYEWNYSLDNGGAFALAAWVSRGGLLDALARNLTASGDGSWGDIYGRLDLR